MFCALLGKGYLRGLQGFDDTLVVTYHLKGFQGKEETVLGLTGESEDGPLLWAGYYLEREH